VYELQLVIVIVVAPFLVKSCVEVAVTLTFPEVLGPAKRPEELMAPALALQETSEL
jgi:hypothetical protein